MSALCRNGGSHFGGHCILQRVDLRYQRGDLSRYLLHVLMLIRDLTRYFLRPGLLIHEALSQRSKRNRILLEQSCVLLQQVVVLLQRGSVLLLGRLNVLQRGDSRIRRWVGSFLVRKQFGQIAEIRQGKIGRQHRIDGRAAVYCKSEYRQRQDRFPARLPDRCRGFGLFGLALCFRCLGHVHYLNK